MSDASRTAVAVDLLSDPQARRLLHAWPHLEPGLADSALIISWSRAAAVPASVTRRLGPVLVQHGLCLPGGKVSDEATRVCATLAAQTLRDAGRSRR